MTKQLVVYSIFGDVVNFISVRFIIYADYPSSVGKLSC